VRTSRDFYDYWTRKESVLKATGQGIEKDLREVEVTPSAQHPSLLTIAGARTPWSSMAALSIDGYAGAVAVLATDPVSFNVIDADHTLRGL